MHIHSISCGQGAPSVFLIWLAGQGVFSCNTIVVADTGGENDMLWSTGQRTNAREFFNEVTKPLAEEFGMSAHFVRANDKHGQPIPDIMNNQSVVDGKIKIDLPMFGSNGGRLSQSCTEKWKKQAIRQQLRRMGAKKATVNLGLTMDEVHRVKPGDLKWETLAWPLIMTTRENGKRGWYRAEIEAEMSRLSIPYIIRSQCDFCPHKNLMRWRSLSGRSAREIFI
jgi:hypothetical protein